MVNGVCLCSVCVKYAVCVICKKLWEKMGEFAQNESGRRVLVFIVKVDLRFPGKACKCSFTNTVNTYKKNTTMYF